MEDASVRPICEALENVSPLGLSDILFEAPDEDYAIELTLSILISAAWLLIRSIRLYCRLT
jgi:hypothetical protein